VNLDVRGDVEGRRRGVDNADVKGRLSNLAAVHAMFWATSKAEGEVLK